MQSLKPHTDQAFLARIVSAADAEIAGLLEAPEHSGRSHSAGSRSGGSPPAVPHRVAMSDLLGLLAVYITPESRHWENSSLLDPMTLRLDRLEFLQGSTGLFDGVNLCSPPDSAFTINDACLALELLEEHGNGANRNDGGNKLADASNGTAALADVGRRLRGIVSAATPALVQGGVHTPNHRWELSAALARIHRLNPSPEIDRRVDEWLSEGIDQLPDGMYSERSPLYATAVTNPSLLAIADASRRTWLLDFVRRNLQAFLPWFNSDGTVESVFSRRQDQWLDFYASGFELLYRRFAIAEGRLDFAAAASWLGGLPPAEPAKILAKARIMPLLAEALPQSDSEEALLPAAATLENCGAFRFREGQTAVTVFGGGDHSASGVASGLSNNPTFLRFRQGGNFLSDVRLSRSFFDLGPFRSRETALSETTVTMREEISAGFYLPLPPERRREDGIYSLMHEGRFSSAMDFDRRPTVLHHLATSVAVRVQGVKADVDIAFEGADTSFALELTFRPGGVLTGVEALAAPDTYQLVAGTGTYTVGGDTIEFGPGAPADPDAPPEYNPGENYKYLNGTNATAGVKVYITGRTRGTWHLVLKGRWRPMQRGVT
ncbi:hypothetical protein [Arthrobacter sp. ISL-30]|uniref:hypothetical protein n=1 Tax=Arthrobacter sp. ISL-30 TaxID=2819109 RepID=UPI001BE8607B|nr:hypothetical protein [Arthrobacter sp. ISL-30]MBT2515723.1 hypothetical protein [Arthrobacter sp. ISL-30]